MPVHTSLRRRAVAFPVALVVAFGAAGFAAAPAYAATADSAAESTPIEVTIETDAVDEGASNDIAPAEGAAEEGAAEEGAAEEVVPGEGAAEEGVTREGAVQEGAAEEGGAEESAADGSATEEGAAEEGAAEEGAAEEGAAEEVIPGAAPDAEVLPFAVLSPEPDARTLTRTVLFAGTGADGAIVTFTDDEGTPLSGTVPVTVTVTDGAWTTTVTFPDDADAAQSVVIVLAAEGAEPESRTVSFTLPEPGAEVPFEIVTPLPGETLPTRTVLFSGTGDEGAVVTVLGVDGQPLPGTQPVTVVAGMWLVPTTYADDAPVSQTATVALSVAGETPRTLDVSFELPATPALPAPVITSPAAGEIVTGDRVTFRGTGQPGAFVGLLVVPTALAQDAALGGDPADGEMSLLAAEPAAPPAPANPADPIPVASDGTWSVTVALAPEDYTVVVVQASDAAGITGLSDPSAPVAFSLRAAPAVVPVLAGSGSNPSSNVNANSNGERLAATGGDDITGLFGISILVMLAGAATVVATRRRATQG
ncbi:hypothetical protein [Microbacterium arborescens]|uniref:hypothetical protein n=1 Tax=Microbacterium arborescens TaxID=33883 RepID=UPI003C711E3B